MKPTPRQIESILAAAVEVDSDVERRDFLEEACAGDAELKRRIEELVENHFRAGSFLEQPAVAPSATGELLSNNPLTSDPQPIEGPGTRVGPYKLLQQIGEGGMGAVFMAEQSQPVQRRVALKIIKPGMDSRQVIARFEAERQALAVMDHPNIAKVFDAGTTETGRPYFVMELVKGVPITQYCDQRRLTPKERLELFIPVCQAVQHAHQKGIIHRDLKPSNVLLALYDGNPVPKVIDFGIAKATGPKLTERTLFTEFGQIVGTLEYMSPEQAELNQLDIDTRSDVYSLGVLLYELLTGTTPLEKKQLRDVAVLELLRLIREVEPPKPSTRLSRTDELPSIAANRGLEPNKLSGLVRGELDWVVMKALEKDRNRRYETANSLALDLQRYLHDEPVQACPPSAVYRMRKFARRNKVALITASVVAFTILLAVAGLAVSTVLVWQANNGLSESLERERQNSYYQRIALADREWSANNLSRMEQLLEECPADLRSWEWHYLKRRPYTTALLLHHDSLIHCVAYSPTGRCVASSSLDGIVKVWDAQTGERLHQLRAHGDRALCLAFSPDGQRLASAGADKQVCVWNVGTGQLLHSWQAHKGVVWRIAFSPDGKYLVSGGETTTTGEMMKGEVKMWDAASYQLVRVLSGPGHYLSVAFSPDGRHLAGSGNGGLRVWDTTSGQDVLDRRESAPAKQTVASFGLNVVAFSPDGRYLAAASGDWETRVDAEVTLWDTRSGEERLTLRGHTGVVSCIAFSPDGRRLASVGMDKTVKIWDVATGREALTLRGHTDFIYWVAFSPDGHRLVSASEDRTVRIWDATPLGEQPPQEPLTLRGHDAGIFGVAFHPDCRHLATASGDATVKVWDIRMGKLEKTFPRRASSVWSVAFRPDGRQLAVTGKGDVRLWDMVDGQDLSVPGLAPYSLMTGVTFSPNGRFFACVGWDKTVRICSAITGLPLRTIPDAHRYAIMGVAISPHGRHIATAGADDQVKVWDAATGQPVVTLTPNHPGRPTSLAFRPDGKVLASASADGTIMLWDSGTWKQQEERRDPTGGVESVVFSPDGRLLAWGSTDATVKIWNTQTKEIRSLHGHTSWVEAVAFSPDGKWLASASLDGTVKLWPAPRVPEVRIPAAGALAATGDISELPESGRQNGR
jgi:WD40 repeat protein/tRNA A-37 threonylcarbamoyl transferase component Bud32